MLSKKADGTLIHRLSHIKCSTRSARSIRFRGGTVERYQEYRPIVLGRCRHPGRWCPGPTFSRCQGRYGKRYLLVCQFVSPQRSATNSQTSNLYCHPSLGDCAGASPSQTPGRPTLHWPSPRCPRTYKGKRSRDCGRTSQPQTLAGLTPLAPQGENNRPGDVVPARASVP